MANVSTIISTILYCPTGRDVDFEKREGQDELEAAVAYDFHSIMHYKYNQFAKVQTLDTIVPKSTYSVSKTALGQREKLSDLDVERIKWMYKCGKCKHERHIPHTHTIIASKIYPYLQTELKQINYSKYRRMQGVYVIHM